MTLFTTLSFIVNHPLNKGRKLAAVIDFFVWQFKSRIASEDIKYEWVNGAKILASKGETGVTGNIYCGLHEFSDMAFLLHLLRPEDTFTDVGANVGSYTVLASAAIGSKTICFEPVPQTYNRLRLNIDLNEMSHKVISHNIALGNKPGELAFSVNQNCMNHVIADGEPVLNSVIVQVSTIDDTLNDTPFLIKIDVEGYELPTLQGASSTLENEGLKAVILELNGSGKRYGFEDQDILTLMHQYGFKEYRYEPFSRRLTPLTDKNFGEGNTLFIRDFDAVQKRIDTAAKVEINGVFF